MDLELELVELCEKFIEILHELKDQSLITEEEYKIHSQQKKKFIEDYAIKAELQ